MPSRIHYAKPSITELEIAYASDAARNGWGERCYEYIFRFEELIRTHVGCEFAIATSSGTGAIQLGLAALGIGAGDEVILGDINWVASAAPIVHLGARPVLVDVLENTWCLDPARVEAAITPRTRAILAVHVYGNMCDMSALLDIARRHGIPLIEDAAEAIGSSWRGRKAGGIGELGIFSFHGTKTVTTGEGGAMVTNDPTIYKAALTLSNHGRSDSESRQFWPERIGYKFKMSNLQAAVGCAQMERVDALVSRKREIFKAYSRAFSGYPVKMNPEPEGTTNGYWMTTVVVDEHVRFERAVLLEAFKENNIDGRVFFWPLSMLPPFDRRPDHVVAYGLYQRGVNLPCYHDLSGPEIDRVSTLVCAVLDDCGAAAS